MSVKELKICKIRNVKTPTRANPTDAGIDFYIPYDLLRTDMAKTFEITHPTVNGRSPSPQIDYDYNTGYAKTIFLRPGDEILVPCGLKVNVPEGHVLKIENKSSISTRKGILVGAGIVDSGYMGEIMVNLHNVSNWKTAVLQPGDKIAQGILYPIETPTITEIETSEELFKGKNSERGEGGFGSSGQS